MIRRLMFAALATATIPAILGVPAAHARPAHAMNAAARMIQMDHISVEVVGKGSPVILIPGLACPRAVWDAFVPDLAKTHTIYVVQVNGFGGDDPRANLKPGVLTGIVGDLHALVGREKLKGAAVVGHSMGGLAGLMWAKANPDDIGKLMIVDSLPYFGVLMAAPGTDVTVAMVEPTARQMRDGIAATYGQPADPARTQAQTAGLALKPASQALIGKWSLSADPRVTALAMYEDLTTDLRPDLGSIRVPVTLLYPWNDVAGPSKAMADPFYRRQYAGLPGVSFVDIGDSAHMVMLDQPEAFRAALTAFLK